MANQTNHDYVGPGNTFDWQIVFFTSKLEEKKQPEVEVQPQVHESSHIIQLLVFAGEASSNKTQKLRSYIIDIDWTRHCSCFQCFLSILINLFCWHGIEHNPFFYLGRGAENQNGNLRWHLPLGVRPPPPEWHKFPDIFLPHFFSFAIESYIYETDYGFYTSKISLLCPLINSSKLTSISTSGR